MRIDDNQIEALLKRIFERFDRVDHALDRLTRMKDAMDGDKLLDNQDMCQLFKIAKRTLAGYRQKKLIPYYILDGKAYYKASEIQSLLKKKGKL